MTTLMHMHSEEVGLRINTDDDGCIWIRQPFATVSLNLSADDRAKLRDALDALDAETETAALYDRAEAA